MSPPEYLQRPDDRNRARADAGVTANCICFPATLHNMLDDQTPQAPPPPPPYSAGYVPRPQYPAAYPPAYPQAAARPQRSPWFYVVTIGGSFAAICLVLWAVGWLAMRSAGGSNNSGLGLGSQIAVLEIDGVIMSPDAVNAQLRKFGDDSSVKAIILRINSPGGGAAASQEIYHEVLRIRQEKHKKIIASVESVGASGAYYIASGCDRIYANEASVVGSIGVIMEWMNYGDLLKWAKLKNITITAGELKSAGDPSRDLTPKEQAYFQSLVDNMYGQFVHDVAVGRHSTDEKIKPLATGQVWTGQQSLGLGLIDKIGGFRTALMDTAKDVGISGEPSILRPSKSKRTLLSLLTDDSEDLFPNPSQMLNRAPGFYFVWK
ncbi:MAG: signal peptide peptidase SppA [Edaphobacter sp.]|uniref:signal peptide peptidase SppA n=1 Tax=Edaphobacter sp. TaxID=1934404 RepID=UPI0023867422|nr:signal peptide peptidase SppA [Edaphobacter sp.]MDE1176274.1 signal peptide peptidase SppA [Edaphobacter sp.]